VRRPIIETVGAFLNKEVNGTRLSPSVMVPCFIYFKDHLHWQNLL
jgi:hypothetical protein